MKNKSIHNYSLPALPSPLLLTISSTIFLLNSDIFIFNNFSMFFPSNCFFSQQENSIRFLVSRSRIDKQQIRAKYRQDFLSFVLCLNSWLLTKYKLYIVLDAYLTTTCCLSLFFNGLEYFCKYYYITSCSFFFFYTYPLGLMLGLLIRHVSLVKIISPLCIFWLSYSSNCTDQEVKNCLV